MKNVCDNRDYCKKYSDDYQNVKCSEIVECPHKPKEIKQCNHCVNYSQEIAVKDVMIKLLIDRELRGRTYSEAGEYEEDFENEYVYYTNKAITKLHGGNND